MLKRRSFVRLGMGMGTMAAFGSFFGCSWLPGSGNVSGGTSSVIEPARIRSVSISSGGGMTGGGESSTLKRQNDGSVTLVTASKEWHNSRERSTTYTLDESAFERFAEIANEYDLRAASKRKQSDLMALDAPTSTLSYDLMGEDGRWDRDGSFSISDTQELTKRDSEGWRAVAQALAELAAAHEGVESIEPRTFRLTVRGVQYPFTSNMSSAAEDLASRMPLNVTLENHADNEKIFYLDTPLDASDTPLASGEAGTLCYFAPKNNMVIFCAEGAPCEGLYELGRAENDWDVRYLAEIEPGEATIWCDE